MCHIIGRHPECHLRAELSIHLTAKPGGTMSGGMMMGQNETGKLVEQLMKSFAAIEAEKDPAVLQAKLAEHGSLLEELQTKVQAQSHMMDMMQQMMGGSMMNGKMMGELQWAAKTGSRQSHALVRNRACL
jgi:hypothetical protein